LRRRMSVAHADGDTSAGADVFNAGESTPIGTVVMAARAPGGGTDLLFECSTDKLDRPMCVNSGDGPPLVVRPLPYELFDPTA
jgi:tRNA-modifying protein YgfZ